MNVFVTGFCPTHVKIMKSTKNNQKNTLKIGLNVVFQTKEVFVNGMTNKTRIALIIATIPPTLCGKDLRIA